MEILETAHELYQLLEQRNLHMRGAQKGRDDALYASLKARLGCVEQGVGLGTWLRTSGISARTFLNAFFGVVQPLSVMYRDIYRGMKAARVKGANEVARVAFGAGDSECDVDLEQFATWMRDFVNVVESRQMLLWDDTSLGCFADVGRALVGDHPELVEGADGLPFLTPLPPSPGDAALAAALRDGHEVVGTIVEMMRSSGYQPAKAAQITISVGALNEVSRRLEQENPRWDNRHNAMRMLAELPYNPSVREEQRESVVHAFRKVLDLPLWQHRWYLYEIWTAFEILRNLSEYAPTVHVDNQGRLALVRGRATRLASFCDCDQQEYTVEAQLETPISHPKRRGVCPDYRVVGGGTTLLVVECKQRALLVGPSLEENMTLYELGCADSKVNVFVNYDQPDGAKSAPSTRTVLVEQFRPGMPAAARAFDDTIQDGLARAGIVATRLVIMLDVSGSMDGKYEAESHQVFWNWCSDARIHAIYTFNDDLRIPIALESLSAGWSSLACGGGTKLDLAVKKLRERYSGRLRLLVITDQIASEHPGLQAVKFWCPSKDSPPAMSS